MQKPLSQLIKEMTNNDPWEDAALNECLEYVKKSKYLKVPDAFKDLLS